MGEARTPLGRCLQELMAARGIGTLSEFGLRLKQAGYRRCCQSVVSQWMRGHSRPQSVPKLCYYLDRALQLTEDEKQSVAAALGRAEYPVPRKTISEPQASLHPHLQPLDYCYQIAPSEAGEPSQAPRRFEQHTGFRISMRAVDNRVARGEGRGKPTSG